MNCYAHLLVVSLLFASSNTPPPQTFQGEISDTQCAFNVHSSTNSQDEMIRTHTMGGTPEECALACVRRNGGKYVLIDRAHSKMYRLDPQKEAEKFAGKEVVVRGTYDKDADILHAIEIKSPRPATTLSNN